MSAKNLQDVLDQAGDTVDLLRNSQLGAYIYPVVPAEFTNFRREVIAWRETARWPSCRWRAPGSYRVGLPQPASARPPCSSAAALAAWSSGDSSASS